MKLFYAALPAVVFLSRVIHFCSLDKIFLLFGTRYKFYAEPSSPILFGRKNISPAFWLLQSISKQFGFADTVQP